MDVAVFSNLRWLALAVERETTVIHEAAAGDESHCRASCVRLMNPKEADPTRLRETMPAPNLLGRLLECGAAHGEACRKREIEAYSAEDKHQERRLKKKLQREDLERPDTCA